MRRGARLESSREPGAHPSSALLHPLGPARFRLDLGMSLGLPSCPLLSSHPPTPSVHPLGPTPGPQGEPFPHTAPSESLCLRPQLQGLLLRKGLPDHPPDVPLDARTLLGSLQSTSASPRESCAPRRVWAPLKRGLVWDISSVHVCKAQNRSWHIGSHLGLIGGAGGSGCGRESQGELVLKDE